MSNRFFPNYPRYRITSRFGMRTHPVKKVKKMHKGIDLVAKTKNGGSAVDAITAHTDGQHLTLTGYERITPQIEAWMRSL